MFRCIVIAACLLFQSLPAGAQNAESPHFTLQRLADGVYAAIAKPAGHAICNAGIVDLGGTTVVIDPFMTPGAAADLRAAAQRLFPGKISYVVVTHGHNDHVGGLQVFAGATIIATAGARSLFAGLTEEWEDMKKNAPVRLQGLRKAAEGRLSDWERDENTLLQAYFGTVAATADTLRYVLPDLTFDDSLTLHGSRRTLRLRAFRMAHTGSDLVAEVPESRVLFAGDLVFSQIHPWLSDGDPDNWRTVLDTLVASRPALVVPGHGPVGDAAAFAPMHQYIRMVRETAAELARKGTTPQQAATLPCPPPFDTWHLAAFFRPNVIDAYRRIAQSK